MRAATVEAFFPDGVEVHGLTDTLPEVGVEIVRMHAHVAVNCADGGSGGEDFLRFVRVEGDVGEAPLALSAPFIRRPKDASVGVLIEAMALEYP